MTNVLTKNGQYTHFDINSLPTVSVKFDEKMGYQWPDPLYPPAEIKNTRVIINVDGKVSAYCRACDAYKPYEDMAKDNTNRLGVIPYCKPCYNFLKRTRLEKSKSNGVSHIQNATIVDPYAEVVERAPALAVLEQIWIEAEKNKHITFDNLIQMGFGDKMKIIYITRWFGICDELREKMDEEIGPNIEAYYVGQTNGKDPTYNGSGSNVDKLNNLVEDYPHVEEEVRIIEITNLQDTDKAEYIKIKETGAIKYGLNEIAGTINAATIPIKIQLNPSNDDDLDAYHDLLFRSKESGISLEEITKNALINGITTRHMFQDSFDTAADNGNILPYSHWHKNCNF